MDGQRFDSFTRSLATGLSRRRALKVLFGGAVLGGAAATHLDQAAAQCPDGQFGCNGECCPDANNCCGGNTCCPSSQCNQTSGTCCAETEFACGTGCCDIQTEKCCDGVCISAALCCPSLPDCAQGLTCCNGECVDLASDPANCGACASGCSSGLLCCQGVCQECCSTGDCDPCERCIDGGACHPVDCEDPCLVCDRSVDQCVSACPDNQHCCVSGPPADTTVTCVDGSECCETDQCGSCATCTNGSCVADVIPCPVGEIGCCDGDELICSQCCHNSDCDDCHLCHQGRCVRCEAGGLICCDDVCVDREECCVPFGNECGLLEVTSAGGDWPSQLDCCDGLVCCESNNGSVCAECCTDHECPKGSICCSGQCREMECCIDDVLVGLDPNRRCPDGCSCFEGICDCHCQSNNDCAWGTCCCNDGTCSQYCCDRGCNYDKDCGSGTCCCHDGSCSANCCKQPPSTLPNTGSGRDAGSGSNVLGTAALGALAAYYAARKLREQQPDEAAAEE